MVVIILAVSGSIAALAHALDGPLTARRLRRQAPPMSGEIAIPEPRDASVAAVRELLALLPALRTRIRRGGLHRIRGRDEAAPGCAGELRQQPGSEEGHPR
jgi:hypothetical protein